MIVKGEHLAQQVEPRFEMLAFHGEVPGSITVYAASDPASSCCALGGNNSQLMWETQTEFSAPCFS